MTKIYDVILLDKDGCEVAHNDLATNLKEAKQKAKYLLSDRYAHSVECTHDEMETHKVEVRLNDVCVWDAFR